MNKILILDKDLTQETIISSWISFTFNRQLNSMGSFELVINANSRHASLIETGQILYCDDKRCGYINKIEISSQGNIANENMMISGIELKDVIASRITYPPTGLEAWSYTNQTTEDIVRDLLDKMFINAENPKRNISIFQLGSALGVGTNKDFSTRLKPLDSQIYELLVEDTLGLSCTVDLFFKNATLTVVAGVDRTIVQNENPRAIFSLNMGTLQNATTLNDESAYKSMGYVGGQGEGILREIIEIGGDVEGINRWEVFIDARDAETSNELITRGNAKLAEFGKVYSMDATAYNTDKLIYALGDFVTLRDRFNNYQNVQITAVQITYSGAAIESKSLTFGNAPNTIAKAVNSRLSGLNNILTN